MLDGRPSNDRDERTPTVRSWTSSRDHGPTMVSLALADDRATDSWRFSARVGDRGADSLARRAPRAARSRARRRPKRPRTGRSRFPPRERRSSIGNGPLSRAGSAPRRRRGRARRDPPQHAHRSARRRAQVGIPASRSTVRAPWRGRNYGNPQTLERPTLGGEARCQLPARMNPKLCVAVREVGLDRVDGDVEFLRDLLVGAAAGRELGDASLARGELAARAGTPRADAIDLGARLTGPARGADLLERGQRFLQGRCGRRPIGVGAAVPGPG